MFNTFIIDFEELIYGWLCLLICFLLYKTYIIDTLISIINILIIGYIIAPLIKEMSHIEIILTLISIFTIVTIEVL